MRPDKPLVLLAAGAFLFLVLSWSELSTPPQSWTPQEVTIPKGASFKEVLLLLKERGLIGTSLPLYLYGRITGTDRRIRAGIYRFQEPLSPLEILRILKEGRGILLKVVIPEGLTVSQIAEILEREGVVKSKKAFLEASRDRHFLQSLGLHYPSLEGFLFPDTYLFSPGEDPKKVIRVMVDNFRRHWPEAFSLRAKELGFTDYEVLTLASIIEKETSVSWEKPLISAVFHNRLKKRMPLCADPTVIYGLGESFRGDLRREHLRTPSPYNTYLLRGLPPTPICNPGVDSLRAALYPADVPYLYFVSKNDGTHHFSRTLKEHNRAVRIYQRRLKLPR